MRKRFEIQYELGATPVEEIEIDKRSRDELPAVIRSLQYIYTEQRLNEEVFGILEESIKPRKHGTQGMSLWEILVLGVVRLALDIDYDRLQHIANNDIIVRKMLGVKSYGVSDKELKKYPLQTIKDNVKLLKEGTIDKINDIVSREGYKLKKKGDEGLRIKIDSYVLESNVHFPTDYNILYDSLRKSLDTIEKHMEDGIKIPEWRKINEWKRKIKSGVIKIGRIRGKNKERRLKSVVRKYLTNAEILDKKIFKAIKYLAEVMEGTLIKEIILEEIVYYYTMLKRNKDLLRRRVLKEEEIPHNEKIFSIFEPYTEWINKGKSYGKIELGLKIGIGTDQYGFIRIRRVMEKELDVESAIPMAEEMITKLGKELLSISFDKSYWSKDNYNILTGKIKEVVMPKKGKLNKEELERESKKEFKRILNEHSGVESNINSLEHHGLNRCPDRGIKHFRNYSALGVLSYNLHLLGNILLEADRKREKKRIAKAA
jgi:transposase, IS5 family